MNTEQFETQAIALRKKTDGLMVIDNDSFVAAGSYEQTAKEAIISIKTNMKESIEEAHSKHKKLVAIQKKLIGPFEEVRSEARKKRLDYQQEQERIAIEKQRKDQEEADRLAEQKRQEEIAEAEAFGTGEEEELKAAPVEAPVIPVARPAVKVKGARTLWSAEITDLKALALAVGQGIIALDLIEPNMVALNSMAVDYKDKPFPIPGVKAVSRTV